MQYHAKEKMTQEKNSGASIDTIELCKKIEEQISIYSKKNTKESNYLVNEILRPSLLCIKINEATFREISRIGSKHFT